MGRGRCEVIRRKVSLPRSLSTDVSMILQHASSVLVTSGNRESLTITRLFGASFTPVSGDTNSPVMSTIDDTCW